MIKLTVFGKAYPNCTNVRRGHLFLQAPAESAGNNIEIVSFQESANGQEIISMAEGKTVTFAREIPGQRQRLLPDGVVFFDRCPGVVKII